MTHQSFYLERGKRFALLQKCPHLIGSQSNPSHARINIHMYRNLLTGSGGNVGKPLRHGQRADNGFAVMSDQEFAVLRQGRR